MTAIRSAIENAAGYLADHPDEATELDTPATAILVHGLSCRVQGPFGELTTDMATSLGGGGSAPSPGWLMRAALASCDATIVAMEAARSGVELTKLVVSVVNAPPTCSSTPETWLSTSTRRGSSPRCRPWRTPPR